MVYVLLVVLAIFLTEIYGYVVHRLLHSESIRFLSRAHMIHHLKLYGPKDRQTNARYLDATQSRFGIAGTGVEWILPIVSYIGAASLVLWLLASPWQYYAVYLGVSILWAIVTYSYIHDAFHLKNHWIERTPLKHWFWRARWKHRIHHLHISPDGCMDKNFGISFYWLDRLVGTYQIQEKPLDETGYQAALKRYAYVLGDDS